MEPELKKLKKLFLSVEKDYWMVRKTVIAVFKKYDPKGKLLKEDLPGLYHPIKCSECGSIDDLSWICERCKSLDALIKDIESFIVGYKVTAKSDVVKRNNAEEYMEGYVDGLNNALNMVKNHAR